MSGNNKNVILDFIKTELKEKLAIDSNNVLINGKVINKGSYDVKEDDMVEVQGNQNPYVSRGGLKLEAALKSFYVDVKGKTVLDIGASTGGFTDCALLFRHCSAAIYRRSQHIPAKSTVPPALSTVRWRQNLPLCADCR